MKIIKKLSNNQTSSRSPIYSWTNAKTIFVLHNLIYLEKMKISRFLTHSKFECISESRNGNNQYTCHIKASFSSELCRLSIKQFVIIGIIILDLILIYLFICHNITYNISDTRFYSIIDLSLDICDALLLGDDEQSRVNRRVIKCLKYLIYRSKWVMELCFTPCGYW